METLIADTSGKIKIGTTIFMVKNSKNFSLNRKLNTVNTKVHPQAITFFLNSKSRNISIVMTSKCTKIPNKY